MHAKDHLPELSLGVLCVSDCESTSARVGQTIRVRQEIGNEQTGLPVKLNLNALAALHYCILLGLQIYPWEVAILFSHTDL